MSYTITKRPMELADFLKVKKIKPYSNDRSNSKTVNFATIFACSGVDDLPKFAGRYTEKS